MSGLDAQVASVAAVLRAGGIVVYPTETFYGLGALARDAAAVARLAAAKGRPEAKPLPLVAEGLAQVEEVARLDTTARRLAAAFWPGPLTLVLPALPGLAPEVTAGSGTVAVRVPGSEVARALARLAGGALVATSANLSGEPPVTTAAQISAPLRARLDGLLDGGPTPGGLASTIVALDAGGPRLVREGPISLAAVLAAAR